MLQLIHGVGELKAFVLAAKAKGKLALVPTMGNLHEGHLSLVEEARRHADTVIVSVFVNPTQFGAGEDFETYPRTLTADCDKLAGLADAVFAPDTQTMYPVYPPEVTVRAGSAASGLCGASRPGHFDGVCTVVAKLFNLCEPHVACFGEKDFQQLSVIRQMARDLSMPVSVIGVPTMRAADGLALSSRNGFLSDAERALAVRLSQVILSIGAKLTQGEVNFGELETKGCKSLTDEGFVVDYVRILNEELEPPTLASHRLVVLVAAKLGSTRLIDNMTFSRP